MSVRPSVVMSFFDNFKIRLAKTDTRRADLTSLPANIGRLPKGQHFSVFKQKHAEEARLVYNYLIDVDSDLLEGQMDLLRTKLNEGLFVYAVTVACLHRKDIANNLLPQHWEIHPTNYIPRAAIQKARNSTRTGSDDVGLDDFITGSVRDLEFKVSWFREDVQLNSHHHHWHLVYPHRGIGDPPKTKDRQGELFTYMHQQMLARYDAERLGVGLMRVTPYSHWNQPIPEGYDSHLNDYSRDKLFSARPANMYLADSWEDPESPQLVIFQEYHYHRILDAINTGKFVEDTLTDEPSPVTIDSLGAAVEASVASPNPSLYGEGGLHNIGHDLLAKVTDPDHRYKSAMGIMGDSSVSIRDPIFYRWHKFIDNLFELHRVKLSPYSEECLRMKAVTIESLECYVSPKKDPTSENIPVLTTRMELVEVDVSNDMFMEKEEEVVDEVKVKVRQVNHAHFKYKIKITATQATKVAFRIFIAPTYDEQGNKYPLRLQRRLFIEMDKFVRDVSKTEVRRNVDICRSSHDSSVIQPPPLPFGQVKKSCTEGDFSCLCHKDRYCGCGWPAHMLLPRGTSSGMQFDLFVMATDWADDSITDLDKGTSYCGVKDANYPDKRTMGFPFDRKIDIGDIGKEVYIKDFADKFCNMFTIPIKIKYNES